MNMTADRGPVFSPDDRLVLVASTGGHLEQLHRWVAKWRVPDSNVHWVTFPNEQSLSLLSSENTTFVDYVRPRDVKGTLLSIRPVARAAREIEATGIVSTGAAIAVSAAIAGYGTGTPFTYIESLARVDHFSTTAKILRLFPRIRRFVQSERLSSERFAYQGSILDDFAVEKASSAPQDRKLRVFVTVGTIKPFGFDRLLRAIEPLTNKDEVVWQIGESRHEPSHGTVHRSMARADLLRELAQADVVIAHAGVGSILSSLAAGRVPLVAARVKRHAEHIDDHQTDIANLLDQKGLVRWVDPENLSREDLLAATSFRSKAVSDE